ncbi:MAG: type II secretion system protein [Sarcina sp.]
MFKRKKGFTLIELVIVLAVLAIIALIAIPNFTKVRNDSMEKADLRAAEQIEKITLMAIANENITLPAANITSYTLYFTNKNFKALEASGTIDTPFEEMLRDVKAPQLNPTTNTSYFVNVDKNGEVEVRYNDSNGTILAGGLN